MNKLLSKKPKIPKEKALENQSISRNGSRLIDLDRKYNFLKDASKVLDLCAAPGGWSNVLSRKVYLLEARKEEKKCVDSNKRVRTNENADIVAVDIKDMKSVPQVTFIKGDIMKQTTVKEITERFKEHKVDLVLFDGELESVDSLSGDILNHSQLLLGAILIACSVLKLETRNREFPGGTFVAKILTNGDSSLIKNQLLALFQTVKVETFEPFTDSSFCKHGKEEYAVCFNYQPEADFDPKLLAPYLNPTYRNYSMLEGNNTHLIPFIIGDHTEYERQQQRYVRSFYYRPTIPANNEETEKHFPDFKTDETTNQDLKKKEKLLEQKCVKQDFYKFHNVKEQEANSNLKIDEAAHQDLEKKQKLPEQKCQEQDFHHLYHEEDEPAFNIQIDERTNQELKIKKLVFFYEMNKQFNKDIQEIYESLNQSYARLQRMMKEMGMSDKNVFVKLLDKESQEYNSSTQTTGYEECQQSEHGTEASNQTPLLCVAKPSQQIKSQDEAASQKSEQAERRVESSSQKTESVIKSDKSSQQTKCQSGAASQKNQKLKSAVEDSGRKLETQTKSSRPKTKYSKKGKKGG